MLLHENKEVFHQLILKINSETGIESGIIEKDYYVTLVLRELVKKVPYLIFKGGTSLSKCYKLIHRFSEDIDLTIIPEETSQGKRKKVCKTIQEICPLLGLEINNAEKINSGMQYNHYRIGYPSIFAHDGLKDAVQIDTLFSIKSFPYESLTANSMIGEYLTDKGYQDFMNQYELHSFSVNVQKLERTYIDKIFAICDYYIENQDTEHSRHLYDIFKIYPEIKHDNALQTLISETRKERTSSRFCSAAKSDQSITEILREIVSKDFYKSDYKNITQKLLFENVSYDQVVEVINEIVNGGFFD